jgi:hypothetical protein
MQRWVLSFGILAERSAFVVAADGVQSAVDKVLARLKRKINIPATATNAIKITAKYHFLCVWLCLASTVLPTGN